MLALGYLNRHGIKCTLGEREGLVSMKHSTRGTNFGLRESAYEGWVNVKVAPGDFLVVDDDYFLILSAENDMGATFFTSLKTNSMLNYCEEDWADDANGNPISTWRVVSTGLRSYGQIVTSALRQTDPGLLDTTSRIYYLGVPVKKLGRLNDGDANFRIDSVDDLLLKGVVRAQCSIDKRG